MKNLTAIILCTNSIKGTKSLGSIPLLKINKTKTLLDYLHNNIKSCWPDSQIKVIGKKDDLKLAKYVKQNLKGTAYDHCSIDAFSNECQGLLTGLKNHKDENNVIVFDIGCVLDKNIFKKFRDYDMSKSFVISNTYVDFESKLGCITQGADDNTQNIFFGLPNKLLMYYYIESNHAQEIIARKPARSKFLFELINEIQQDIKVHNIKTKKCININSIKDYKKIKEINFV